MESLAEHAKDLQQYEGDFLSTLRGQRDGKALWRDIYFYVLGDPMKQKTNKIRTYIK